MAASFPNAQKTFSAVVNGVTKLVAALFNSPYDEITAIETFIGPTGGGAQAFSESLTNMLYNYRSACTVDFKSTSDLYVRAGEIMITDASGNRRLRRNPTDTTVTWANIDTGAEAGSTIYYVYAVADSSATTFTIKISTSSSAPSGATFYKLIGSFYNDGSSNITYTFNTTSATGSVPSGGIIGFSGPIALIPTGWYLCNGSNRTPDLRNTFIVGADADVAGVAESTITGSALQTHATGIVGNHVHDINFTGADGTTQGSFMSGSNAGGYNEHQNTATNTSGNAKNIPPFYALAYIMKS